MSNNKQSSVEWLDNELASLNFDYLTGQIDNKEFNERHKSIIEQAKAMHKEEIKLANESGKLDAAKHIFNATESKDSEQYYNETYGVTK